MERTYKAIDGQTSPSGRKYDLNDEAAAWFGFRISTQDAKVALFYRSFEFKDMKADAEKGLRDSIRDRNVVSTDELRDARDLTNRLRGEAYTEMHNIIKSAERSGMSKPQIAAVLRNGGISMDDIRALIGGKAPDWRPNMAAVRKMALQARATYGQEAYLKTVERYRELGSM
jgi:hypothetical protein